MRLRPVAWILAMLLLAAACSGTSEQNSQTVTGTPPPDGRNASETGGGDGSGSNGQGGTASGGRGTTGSGGGSSGTVSGGTTPITVPPAPAKTSLGPGITKDKIKVTWVYSDSTCGASTASVAVPTFEAAADEINVMMQWANKFLDLPGGRKFEWTVEDYGGLFCPDVNRAAAIKIIQELKPFAVVGSTQTAGSTPVVSDMVTEKGILTIGWNYRDEALMRSKHPYAWAENGTDTQALQQLVWYLAKRVKKTKYTSDAGTKQDRVYGLVLRDMPEARAVAKSTAAEMKKHGMTLKVVQYMDDNPGVGAQQAPTITGKLVAEGVNSVLWGATILQSWVLTPVFDAQAYFPDHFVTTTGALDFPELNQNNSAKQLERFSGVSGDKGPDVMRGDRNGYTTYQENRLDIAYRDVWQQMGREGNPPNFQGPNGAWPQAGMLFAGVIAAGKSLNASTFADGLEKASRTDRCLLWRFLGRDHVWGVSRNWSPKVHGAYDRFKTIYWVNKDTPDGYSGYYESYDGYEMFPSFDALPSSPSDDTGKSGPPKPPKQTPSKYGIRPSVTCKSLGLGSGGY